MKTFDPGRFLSFLRFDVGARRQEVFLPLVVPPCVVVLMGILRLSSGEAFTTWPTTAFLMGLFLAVGAASKAHAAEKNPLTAPFFCLLPVSHAERFVARLLTGLALPFFGQCFVLTLVANLFAGLSGLLLPQGFGGFLWPEFKTLLNVGGGFFLLHSVFFTGGLFFQKSTGLKTLLCAMVYGFVLSLVGVFLTASGIAERASFLQAMGALLSAEETGVLEGYQTMTLVFRLSWFALFPLLLFAAAAFKARELEVRE